MDLVRVEVGKALVVAVTGGHVVVGLAGGTLDRERVVLRRGRLVEIDVLHIPVSIVTEFVVVVTEDHLAIRGLLAVFLLPAGSHFDEVVAVEVHTEELGSVTGTVVGLGHGGHLLDHGRIVRQVGSLAPAEVVVVAHLHAVAGLSALGGDQHHTESSARTVDRGGGGILQDGDRCDVLRVEVGQVVDRNAVDHVERGGRTAVGQGTDTTDHDGRLGVDVTVDVEDGQTGDSTLQGFAHAGRRLALEGLRDVDGRDGAGQVGAALRAVTDHDGFVEEFGVICQNDVDHSAAGHGDLLGLVADAGKRKCTVGGYVDGVGTVDIRRSSCGRSNNDHVGTYDRLVVLIDHLTGDGNVLSQHRSH